MLLKRFEADSLPAALDRVRTECGDHALVVETRQTRKGFLVVAANPDSAREQRDQAGRITAPERQRWTRGFEPLANQGLEFGLSPRLLSAIESALLGTRVEMGKPGDPALPGLASRVLQALLPTEDRFEGSEIEDSWQAITLVGPTGVGKTTTLAKLAARAVEAGQDVAILTLDTYRVAAVEQLRAFADLLDVPMEVVFTPQDLRRALQVHGHRDRIYVDTTGRSPLDTKALQTLSGTLGNRNTARLLCLAANTRRRDADAILDAYDRMGLDGVCLTKWDETTMPGESLSAVAERDLRLSHIGTGQEVPRDIEKADSTWLARAAFGLDTSEARR